MEPYSQGYQPLPSNNNQPTPNDSNQNPYQNSYQPGYNAQPMPYNQPYNNQPYIPPYNSQPYNQLPNNPQPYGEQSYPQPYPQTQQPYNQPYVEQTKTPQEPDKPIIIAVETEPTYLRQPFSPMVSDGESRLRFVRKVLTIVTLQLMLVTGICALCMFPQSVANYLTSYDGQWVFWVSVALEFTFLIILIFVRKKTPLNFAILILFTASTGMLVGCTVSYYSIPSVFEAFIITVLTTVCLVGYVYFTKSDFRILGPAILCLSLVALWWCLFTFLWSPWWYYGYGQPTIVYDLICLLGIVIFVLYILYDTSKLMHRFDESEYILGAVNLYLDILNLFLCLLGLFGKSR